MKILGLDPGKTTGWALIEIKNKKIVPINKGHDKDMSMIGQAEYIKEADLVVIEDFLVDPKFAKRGAFNYNDMPAPQVIGSIKTLCQLTRTPWEMQSPSVKPVGYGFLGKTYKKGAKDMHSWDALAHVVYYVVKKRLAVPPGSA